MSYGHRNSWLWWSKAPPPSENRCRCESVQSNATCRTWCSRSSVRLEQVQPPPDRWIAAIEVHPDPVDDDITPPRATQIGTRYRRQRFRYQTQIRALAHAAHLRASAESIGHHVGMPLSERALLKVAGDRSYARGEYRRIGRIDDAIAVLRADFVRQPAVRAYRSLLGFAATIDRADTERAWALDHARELASGPDAGSVLVQLSLSERDVDAAWEAADRYGPGWAWQELATRGAEARPVAAQICTGRSSRTTCSIPTPGSTRALPRRWLRWPSYMKEAVALLISRRTSPRSGKTTAGVPP